MSNTGIPSVIAITVCTPASIASSIAGAAKRAGTKIIDVLAPCSDTASAIESKMGTPSTSWPPLPGVTPATIWVPAERLRMEWNRPCSPVSPCTTTFVPSSMRTDASGRLVRQLGRAAGGFLHGGRRHDPFVSGFGQDPSALLRVGPVQADHDGNLGVHPVQRLQDPPRHQVTARDSPEDVHEDGA